jgi:hypothetical protein
MEPGEWVWADSAYPVSVILCTQSLTIIYSFWFFQVDIWIVSPYKKPERDLPDNEEFNKHVSRVRIRSEHAIGFLKGRFHSLKNLRLKISDKRTHILATYWVAACIGVHSFAMQCEENERRFDNADSDLSAPEDPFIAEGLSSSSDADRTAPSRIRTDCTRANRLQIGKAHREKLKEALFCSKARRVHRNRRTHAERHGVHLSNSDSDADMD